MSTGVTQAVRVPGEGTRRLSTTRGSLDLRENWLKHINIAKRLMSSGLNASLSTSWLSMAPASESSPTCMQNGSLRLPQCIGGRS